jgi:hypothetical protein
MKDKNEKQGLGMVAQKMYTHVSILKIENIKKKKRKKEK